MRMREERAPGDRRGPQYVAEVVVVSRGARHVLYDPTTPLVVAPCGRQHPLAKWLPDDPAMPWCDICLIFHDDPQG